MNDDHLRISSPPARRGSSASLALAAAAVVALTGVGARGARAAVLDVVPQTTAGATDNARGSSGDQAVRRFEMFNTVGTLLQLRLTGAQAEHRVGYALRYVYFTETQTANNVSSNAFWSADIRLGARTTLGLAVNTTLFRYSAITAVSPALADPTAAPTGFAPGYVVAGSANESLVYQPSGRVRYTQSLDVGYMRPLDDASQLRTLLRAIVAGRAELISGRTTLSLTGNVGTFVPLSSPAVSSTPTTDARIVTMVLMAGWGYQFSANGAVDVNGGAMGFLNARTDSVAIGPAGEATIAYRLAPWFATLTVAQQPIVNMYIGEAVIADLAVARLSLPVDARDTVRVAGFGGYTYARRITTEERFVYAPRAYDLFTLGLSLSYQPERWPIAASLEYSVMSQRGSLHDGRYYPSTLRRVATLSVSGTLSWGEGNSGFRRR